MPQADKLTVQFVYRTGKEEKLPLIERQVVDRFLSATGIQAEIKGNISTYRSDLSIPLRDVFSALDGIAKPVEGVVMSTLSKADNNIITFMERTPG